MTAAAVAADVTAFRSFPFLSGNPFRPRPFAGFLPSSPPPPPPPCVSSSSTRPSPEQQSGQGLTSAALMSSCGAAITLVATSYTFPSAAWAALPALQEPQNALSLPTWAIHVSSVAEWVTAMALVWEYGEKSGFEAWKGLSWGMVPLLGGAMCACTWHFFYNSESLEVLVAMQGALTLVGNVTMCIAAFRIFKAYQGSSNSS